MAIKPIEISTTSLPPKQGDSFKHSQHEGVYLYQFEEDGVVTFWLDLRPTRFPKDEFLKLFTPRLLQHPEQDA